ncbi:MULTISPECIES: MerR family transcriptional regulator [unclassified Enterococcus]|jgi:DNA-binding transcriptional MerR regulator|uniref:MerR family transcriptional regulator n=1 Tax=unclassified Enterococcus TaxID=2608891 RepID=UPI003D2A00DF
MDKKTFHIKDVLKLTKLKKSTIRYWEREGLLNFNRNQDNNYRVIDSRTLLDLLDIVFYRNLNIPIKKLKSILHQKPEITYEALIKSEQNLMDELNKITRQKKFLEHKKQSLEELVQLQKNPASVSFPMNFSYVEQLSFSYMEHVSQYSTSPTNFVLFFQGNEQAYQEGIIVDKKLSNHLLFEKKKQKIIFGGLLEVDNLNYQNNNLELLLKQANFPADTTCIAQYLSSGKSETGKVIDYYKCWFLFES